MLGQFLSLYLAFLQASLLCVANGAVINCRYSLTNFHFFVMTIVKANFRVSIPEYLDVYPSGAFDYTMCVCNGTPCFEVLAEIQNYLALHMYLSSQVKKVRGYEYNLR